MTPFPRRLCDAISLDMETAALHSRASGSDAAYGRAVAAIDEAEQVWPHLAPIEALYPGFNSWYWHKVVPNLGAARRIIRLGPLARPSGLAIVKREPRELKICTLWVAEHQRGKGCGRLLMEEAISWLGTEHPLFTVPEERMEELQPLMDRFGFRRTATEDSLYRLGVAEHIFNGGPPTRTSW